MACEYVTAEEGGQRHGGWREPWRNGHFLKRVPRAGLRSKHVCVSPAALGANSLGKRASRLQEELSEVSCRGTAWKEWTSPRRRVAQGEAEHP